MLSSKHLDSERDSVEAARSGSEEAWRQLFEAHYPGLLRYFRVRVQSADTAEDLAAETFAEAFRSLGGFQWRNRPFGAWLFGIARHRLLMHFRGRRPTGGLPDELPSRADDYLAVQVRDALARLPSDYREAIELSYLVGLSGIEAAAAMGRSHGAYRILLMRASRAFRREYGLE
jgi:RNA polymerase sigma-70 factor, ECF subfamily